MICRIATLTFAVLYALATFVFLTGTFGWFGQEKDALSGVFLLPLGVPWVLLLEGLSDRLMAIGGVLAPMLNLGLLLLVCRRVRRGNPK